MISIFKSLLEILKYLHNLNPAVIHRDIQPKNIILSKDQKVYLVDFGSVGQIARDTLTAGNTFVGTIGYFPQEQMMGKVYPNSDLYALAMSMIFILTGKNPIQMDMREGKVLYSSYVHLSDELKSLLDKMIEPFQERRYQTALEVLKKLEEKPEPIEREYIYKNIIVAERPHKKGIEEKKTLEAKTSEIKLPTIPEKRYEAFVPKSKTNLKISREDDKTIIKINNDNEERLIFGGAALIVILFFFLVHITHQQLNCLTFFVFIMIVPSFVKYFFKYLTKLEISKDSIYYQSHYLGIPRVKKIFPQEYFIDNKFNYDDSIFNYSYLILYGKNFKNLDLKMSQSNLK